MIVSYKYARKLQTGATLWSNVCVFISCFWVIREANGQRYYLRKADAGDSSYISSAND